MPKHNQRIYGDYCHASCVHTYSLTTVPEVKKKGAKKINEWKSSMGIQQRPSSPCMWTTVKVDKSSTDHRSPSLACRLQTRTIKDGNVIVHSRMVFFGRNDLLQALGKIEKSKKKTRSSKLDSLLAASLGALVRRFPLSIGRVVAAKGGPGRSYGGLKG